MISNQILQNTLDGLTQLTKVDLAVLDLEAVVCASTLDGCESYIDSVRGFVASEAESQVALGCHFFKIFDDQQLEYIVLSAGPEDQAAVIGKIAAFQIHELLIAYKERFDKDNFFKNLLLDNLLLVDIYNRSKKLHVDIHAKRVVMVVEVGPEKFGDELDRVRTIFGGKNKDFVTAVDEHNIIVIKELGENDTNVDIDKIAAVIIDAFHDRDEQTVRVSYGTVIGEIKEVSKSYKEASMAMDVGKIFFSDKTVIAYSALGIGRLIYQLPIPLCKMFISEIFENRSPDDFDEETLVTINKFFENNLNVSETSRKLYIHRNTLVYRLDKLEKSTGLDLRVFEDAITFKIALMVVKYMKYMEDEKF